MWLESRAEHEIKECPTFQSKLSPGVSYGLTGLKVVGGRVDNDGQVGVATFELTTSVRLVDSHLGRFEQIIRIKHHLGRRLLGV